MEPKLLVLFFCPSMLLQKKNSNGFLSPKQGACFFLKFPKFIIGKCLSFLASFSLYERMENIWRQCQGMLSCHFHVGFPWCERVSACLFTLGNFPFSPRPSPAGTSWGSLGDRDGVRGGSHLAEVKQTRDSIPTPPGPHGPLSR